MKIKSIQGIRGYAITMIVLWHLNSIFPGNLSAFGDRGVEFFFLISGLLIGIKYYYGDELSCVAGSLKYAIKKGKAIYPLYVLSMTPFIILLAVALLKHKQSPIESIVIVVSNLLYCQSWFPNEAVFWSLNGATWFLSSLLFCYMTTFFYFKLLHRINPKVMVAAIFIIKFTWEAWVSLFFPQKFIYLAYIFPVYRSLDFALGLCLGIFYLEDRKKKCLLNKNKQYLLLGAIFVYFIFLLFINKSVTYSVYHLMETFIVWMVISGDNCITRVIFENPLAVHLGDLSDIIFLIHLPMITVVRLLWEKSKIGHDFILWGILVCAVICAAEITRFLKAKFRITKL